MKNFPKLAITDWIIEILAFLPWIFILLSLLTYGKPIVKIPLHYNISGQVESWTDKSGLWILPLIATILYIGLSVLQKYPNIYNYTVKVTADNQAVLYRLAARLVRIIKLICLLLFGYITFCNVAPSWGINYHLNIAIILIFVALITFVPVYLVVNQKNTNKLH